jgi:hypothetical protein
MQHAIQLYQESLSKPKSLRKFCQEMEKCLRETKKVVKLSKSTLLRRINGGRSIQEAHEERKWLSKEEEDTVVKYAIECANHNFPFSHQWIKEHIDEIACAYWGDAFPKGGIGKQWTHRFISNHHMELKAY